jgi:hypothetical protein
VRGTVGGFCGGDRRIVGPHVQLAMRMIERHADGLAAVLEREDVGDAFVGAEIERPLRPGVDEEADPLERDRGHRGVMIGV